MVIHITGTYAKKLGLPNYSSHAYSLTIRTTVQNLEQIEAVIPESVLVEMVSWPWCVKSLDNCNRDGQSSVAAVHG